MEVAWAVKRTRRAFRRTLHTRGDAGEATAERAPHATRDATIAPGPARQRQRDTGLPDSTPVRAQRDLLCGTPPAHRPRARKRENKAPLPTSCSWCSKAIQYTNGNAERIGCRGPVRGVARVRCGGSITYSWCVYRFYAQYCVIDILLCVGGEKSRRLSHTHDRRDCARAAGAGAAPSRGASHRTASTGRREGQRSRSEADGASQIRIIDIDLMKKARDNICQCTALRAIVDRHK